MWTILKIIVAAGISIECYLALDAAFDCFSSMPTRISIWQCCNDFISGMFCLMCSAFDAIIAFCIWYAIIIILSTWFKKIKAASRRIISRNIF